MQMQISGLIRSIGVIGALTLASVTILAQGPLTLSQAVAIALEKNPAHKMALADVEIARASTSMAQSAFLPHGSFSESATVSNDPVYAFGTKLRQARFTTLDFALPQLNHPGAISNFSSRFGGQWNVFNTFANTYEFRRAKALHAVSRHRLTRSDQQIIFQVIDGYYAVLLANKQLELAEQTLKTAQAMVETSSSRVEAGTAVDADALSAKVNLATRREELIRARSAVEMARTQLETALGMRLSPAQQAAELLKEQTLPAAVLEESEARALRQRPDLLALASQSEAQQNSVKAAKAAFGPRLDVFGTWETDNPSMFSGGSNNWTAGAELHVDLFPSEKRARLAAEKAVLTRIDASRQVAEDSIRMEVRRAYFELDAARQTMEVARATVEQSDESLRMTRDRYETGLVTITELLRTEDAARASRTNYWNSVYRYITSYAALELARGDLSPQTPVVTQ